MTTDVPGYHLEWEYSVRVSGTNWLLVRHRGKWIPVFKLTDEQAHEWKEILTK